MTKIYPFCFLVENSDHENGPSPSWSVWSPEGKEALTGLFCLTELSQRKRKSHFRSDRTKPNQTKPGQIKSNQIGLDRIEPNQTTQIEPNRIEPNQTKLDWIGPDQTESN